MRQKKFNLKVRNIFISGDLTYPDNYNGKSIILAHGFSNDRHQRGQFDDLRSSLLIKGYAVCWFDFPGVGKSTGKFEDTTLRLQRQTLNKVVKYTARQKEIDKNYIYLFSMSFATVSAILLNPKEIKAFIFGGTNANPYEIISSLFINSYGNEKVENVFDPKGISRRTNGVGKVLKLKPKFWKSVDTLNLERAIQFIKKPKLFMHGDKDSIAPYSEAVSIYKKAVTPKKIVTIENSGHNFDESKKIRQNFIKETIDWIEEIK